jgi:hypothetical protein
MNSNHTDQEETRYALSPPTHRRTLRTVKQLAQANPAFTQASLRWLLFNREINGLQRVVVKVGRRLLIDEEEFFAWIDEQNGR